MHLRRMSSPVDLSTWNGVGNKRLLCLSAEAFDIVWKALQNLVIVEECYFVLLAIAIELPVVAGGLAVAMKCRWEAKSSFP